jgi:hypothetical protein
LYTSGTLCIKAVVEVITITNHEVYAFRKNGWRLFFQYLFYSSIFIGFNLWFIFTAGLSPKLLVTTILILVIFLTKDLKSKIVIDGETIRFEKLIVKKTFAIHDVARILKGETSSGGNGRFDYFFVQDKERKDIFVLPPSLPQKKEFDQFRDAVHAVNPDVYIDLRRTERKLF